MYFFFQDRENSCLFNYFETVIFNLSLPSINLEKRIADEIDLEVIDHLQGLQLSKVLEDVVGKVKISKINKGHEVIQASLQRVVGKVKRFEGCKFWEVFKRPQITFADN